MVLGKLKPGIYRLRNGGDAEVWERDASGNPLYPFYGKLPASPDDDAWNEHGQNWASPEFDLVERIGRLPKFSGTQETQEAGLDPEWHVDRSEGTKIKDAKGNTVLWTQHTHLHGRRTDKEVSAIAHMAAAAPKMLAILKHMVRRHDQLRPHDIAKAKAVIAEAEGKAID